MSFIKEQIHHLKQFISETKAYRHYKLRANFNSYLKPNITSQLKFKDKSPIKKSGGYRVVLPLIETNHYQYYQTVILLKALELRGCDVMILLCNQYLKGCEIKSVRSSAHNPCLECSFNARNIIPFYDLKTATIAEFIKHDERKEITSIAAALSIEYPQEFVYEGINIIPMVNDSVTRYFYGAVPEEGSEELSIQRQFHIETALNGIVVFNNIISEWKPDALFGSMNVYSAWEPYFAVAEQKGISNHLISRSPFNYNGLVYNQMDLYYNNNRFEKWKATRTQDHLDIEEKEILKKYTSKRFSGNDQLFKDTQMFSDESGKIKEMLNLDPSKRNIFLFSNIFWDIGMNKLGALYDAVVPWVLDTIELIKDDKDCHLYIKIHPIELFDSGRSLKGVADFIRERYPQIPENVTIITPDLKIKTYDLFPFIDLGVVYNGTIGLEMMLNTIPIVITGTAPYNYIKSVNVPSSREDYKQILIQSEKAIKPDFNEIEMFAYFYFIRSLIPWDLTFRAYADEFKKYNFESLDDLMPGKNKYLDHLCNCIMEPNTTVAENW